MKRLGIALSSATAFCVATALPALAGYPPTTEPPTEVRGAGGGSAFTGANISLGVALLAVLVVVGIAALLVSRRRASVTH